MNSKPPPPPPNKDGTQGLLVKKKLVSDQKDLAYQVIISNHEIIPLTAWRTGGCEDSLCKGNWGWVLIKIAQE